MRFLWLLLLLLPLSAHAAEAPGLQELAYRQRPGAALPRGASFIDEAGRTVRIADLLSGRPAVLALGYFHCPNLCGLVRADLYDALDRSGLDPDKDYALIALSIDPDETRSDAAAAKARDAAQFPPARVGHFLTGPASSVREVADAVGLRFRFDPATKQFLHPAGLVFLAPDATVSGYLLGVGYPPADVRQALARARSGAIPAAAMPVLLLCFHYDPATGRYTPSVLKLLRLGAALTVVALGGTMLLAFRRERGAP